MNLRLETQHPKPVCTPGDNCFLPYTFSTTIFQSLEGTRDNLFFNFLYPFERGTITPILNISWLLPWISRIGYIAHFIASSPARNEFFIFCTFTSPNLLTVSIAADFFWIRELHARVCGTVLTIWASPTWCNFLYASRLHSFTYILRMWHIHLKSIIKLLKYFWNIMCITCFTQGYKRPKRVHEQFFSNESNSMGNGGISKICSATLLINTYFHNQNLPFFHIYSRDSRYYFQISVSRNRWDFRFLDADQNVS